MMTMLSVCLALLPDIVKPDVVPAVSGWRMCCGENLGCWIVAPANSLLRYSQYSGEGADVDASWQAQETTL